MREIVKALEMLSAAGEHGQANMAVVEYNQLVGALGSLYDYCLHNVPGMSEFKPGVGREEMKRARLALRLAEGGE